MSTKISKMKEDAAIKTKSSGNYQQSLKEKAHDIKHKGVAMKSSPFTEILLPINQALTLELTVKETKEQERTSPAVNFSPGQKAEKKRSTTNDSKPPQWSNVFTQNLLRVTKEQSSKHNEDRKAKKNMNVKKQQKSMKSKEKHSKTPCCSSPSILVRDCAAQCPEICNSNKIAEFNSAYVMSDKLNMLHLIEQLQDLVNKKDKKTCEIFTEMERIMQKIPDLETKVESNAVPLKESNKNEFMLEREKLQSEILKRDERLKEVDKKYSKLVFEREKLTQQLAEAIREKNNMISVVADLKRQIEDKEKIITDLTDLNTQTEHAHKNFIDNKYLTMEIDKLSISSSYKDKQIIEYQNTVKEFQNQIAKQLKTISEIFMKEGSKNQMSLIHTGHACSSPTSSFSNDSNKSWHDLSDLSSVDSIPEERTIKKDAPVKDYELVSLLDEESSRSIMPDQNEVMNDKRSAMQNNENNTVPYQNVDTNDVNAKKSLRHSSKKGHNKENDIYKMSKFMRLKEKQNDNTKNLPLNSSKNLEGITSIKSTVSDIRKQSDMQNRKPVNVPSPLRDCPHPDWSDSSLPSISTVSNLDMVPSNDV